jgi:hypothetical protein
MLIADPSELREEPQPLGVGGSAAASGVDAPHLDIDTIYLRGNSQNPIDQNLLTGFRLCRAQPAAFQSHVLRGWWPVRRTRPWRHGGRADCPAPVGWMGSSISITALERGRQGPREDVLRPRPGSCQSANAGVGGPTSPDAARPPDKLTTPPPRAMPCWPHDGSDSGPAKAA